MILQSCTLYPSLGPTRCFCCSIICDPADDEGRCATCVERDAWPCATCGVHVYADERHAEGRCEECHLDSALTATDAAYEAVA